MEQEEKNRMPHMTLANIAAACSGDYVGDTELLQQEITGVAADSRLLLPGNLFIPIKGARADGHDFIPQVFEKGAFAVLSERELTDAAGPYIRVQSTTEAMRRLAEYYRAQLSCTVVGITGSVGKTSTKEMIASVLSQRFSVLKTDKNYNNEIGLPLTIFRIRAGHDAAVLEMGISDFGEMHRLAAMAQPNVAVITNIGLCHLEKLGSRDGILQAKTEMLDHLRPYAAIVLNGDDDKLCTKREGTHAAPVFYGMGELGMVKKSVYATDVVNCGLEGMRARIHTPHGDFDAEIPIPGEHNVYNALAATAVGLALGLLPEEIARGIRSAHTIEGRTNVLEHNGMTVIDDCYNANPVSMKAAVEVLAHTKGRRIAVLGDMGELGESEEALHREVGEAVARAGIDALFAAGRLARFLADEAEKNADCSVHWYETRDEMTEALCAEVKEGDTVLIKASHFMEFSKVVEALTK